MASYSLSLWADFCNLSSSSPLPEHAKIEHLFIDTREIMHGENGVFFCLRGRRDGHDFIEDAIARGVLAIVIHEQYDLQCAIPDDVFVFLAKNVLNALSKNCFVAQKTPENNKVHWGYGF